MLTRQVALGAASLTYSSLVDRARNLSDDPDYVDALCATWMAKLHSLAMFRSNPSVSDETESALKLLSEAVNRTSNEDVDALMRWLDVFPSAVAEMFPPSESTFRVQVESASVRQDASADREAYAIAA